MRTLLVLVSALIAVSTHAASVVITPDPALTEASPGDRVQFRIEGRGFSAKILGGGLNLYYDEVVWSALGAEVDVNFDIITDAFTPEDAIGWDPSLSSSDCFGRTGEPDCPAVGGQGDEVTYLIPPIKISEPGILEDIIFTNFYGTDAADFMIATFELEVRPDAPGGLTELLLGPPTRDNPFRADVDHLSTTIDITGTTVVPIPAAAWLLMGALGSLVTFRRRRRS